MHTSSKIMLLGAMLLLVGLSTGCGDSTKAATPVVKKTAPVTGVSYSDHEVAARERQVDELKARCEELEAAEFAREETTHHRYSVVEHEVQSVTEDSRTVPGSRSTWRRHLVNARGEWFEIPESDREWAMAVKEGTVVELPRTVLSWVKVEQSTVLIHGSGMIDALSGEYRAYADVGVMGHDEGIYFFVEK